MYALTSEASGTLTRADVWPGVGKHLPLPCTGTRNPHAGWLSGWFCALSSGFAFTSEVSINQTLLSLDIDGGGLVPQSCLTLCDPMEYIACQVPLSMEFSRQDTGVGCHSLLQGIFPTQGSNPGLLHCRQILYHLSHQGSPIHQKPIIM